MEPKILPPAQAITACQKCGECCKRYTISTLPHELERQAKFFSLSDEKFVGIYTRLMVQLVPFSSGEHALSLHTNMLPKRVWKKLQTMGFDQDHVMILPMLAFKKQEYCIFFNPQTFGCTMHLVKPMQCSLFPFVSANPHEDYSKAYDFCELSKISSPTSKTKEIQSFQTHAMRAYFDEVAKQGMSKTWKALPASGDIIYKNQVIGTISLKALEKWLSVARAKK